MSYQDKLKTLYPNYSTQEFKQIFQYLEIYDIDDEYKIKHIWNLHRLVNIYFNNFIKKE
jgi:hypothetical protein